MPSTKTRRFDAADYLRDDAARAAYLEAALEEGDAGVIAAAIGDIARAKGMTQVARDTGLGRESLYKALAPGANPEFATILKVVSALGISLHAEPCEPRITAGLTPRVRSLVGSLKDAEVDESDHRRHLEAKSG